MLDKTLGYILCCQSPGLFLAAAVLVIAYFAGRRKHRFKAVLKLLLGIVCAVGGVALYYLGMYDEYFTIRDFYQIRPAGWVGVGIAAFFTLLALVRAFFAAADARREEKAANRAENQRLAAEAGVSRSMLGQIERGEANPSVGLLGKLAGALKVPAEVLLENDDFEPLLLLRELDNKAARLDGGKALLRPSLPYDDVLRQETFFLDLYISGRYAPEPMVPGCVCLATSLSGTVLLHAEGQDFQLLERDALRFAADQPFWLENQFNGTARLLLTYRYLK